MDNIVNAQEIIDDFLAAGFNGLYKAEFTPLSENELKVNISGEGVSNIIGQQGKTLLALQHVIRHMYINITGDYEENLKIIIDIDGYKEKRLEKLKNLASSAAQKCISIQKEITLPSMTAYERHVIHDFIQTTYPELFTESVGAEPNRRIVIKKREV